MSDKEPVIVNGIGSPRVWLYINDGEIMRDFDEQPITKYLVEFDYTYNEEEDDECNLKFKFPNLKSFTLPYFKQDVILQVEWGYVVSGGLVIRSPRRKIGIRDISNKYNSNGIDVELKCTDLVSYLKGMKTRTIKNYSKSVIPGNDTPENRFRNASINALGLFMNEVTKGSVTFTHREYDKIFRVNKSGDSKVITTDKKGRPTNILESNLKNIQSGKILEEQVIKGGAKSIQQLLEAYVRFSSGNSADGDSGLSSEPKIVDSTDDNVEIKTRNFNQDIFKSYTWGGGTGELIEFSSSTNTRKNKENKSVSSGIDPFTKKMVSTHVDTYDTKRKNNNNIKRKYQDDQLEYTYNRFAKSMEDIFNNNGVGKPDIPDKVVFSKWKGKEITVNNSMIDMEMGTYGDKKIKDVYVYETVNYADIINSPEFKSYSDARASKVRIYGDRVVSRLTGYTVETIQRKYEGNATTIGDPTLIKGKLYYINNVSKEDTGKWYAVSVKHTIKNNAAYLCELTLMRNPNTVGISAKTLSVNPVFDKTSKKLTLETDLKIDENEIYKPVDEDNTKQLNTIDDINNEGQYREENQLNSMVKRKEILDADKDYIDRIDNGEDLKISNNNDTYINKPNADKY